MVILEADELEHQQQPLDCIFLKISGVLSGQKGDKYLQDPCYSEVVEDYDLDELEEGKK